MKLFDLLQEAIYDIVGFILPGLIALPFIALLYSSDFKYSSVYSLFVDINNIKFIKIFFNNNFKSYVFIIIISFLLGIMLKYISIIIDKIRKVNFPFHNFILKIFMNLKNWIIYNENPNDNYINKYIASNESQISEQYNINTPEFNHEFSEKQFLKSYARVTSRFNGNKNLTQKYIAKTNLFSSLSSLFLLEFINSVCSLIVYFIYSLYNLVWLKSFKFQLFKCYMPIVITILLLFLFLCCYVEFKTHKKLQDNENFFYLLETYFKKH